MRVFAYIRGPAASSKIPSVEEQTATIMEFAQTRALGEVSTVLEEPDQAPDDIFGPEARKRLLFGLKPGDMLISHSFASLFDGPGDAKFVLFNFQQPGLRVFLLQPEWELSAKTDVERFCALMTSIEIATRESRSRRIRAAKQTRKQNSVYLGGKVPFGFRKCRVRDTEELEPDPDQQRAIMRAVELRDRGWSYERIARDLRAKGHHISHVTVSRILKSGVDGAL